MTYDKVQSVLKPFTAKHVDLRVKELTYTSRSITFDSELGSASNFFCLTAPTFDLFQPLTNILKIRSGRYDGC